MASRRNFTCGAQKKIKSKYNKCMPVKCLLIRSKEGGANASFCSSVRDIIKNKTL